MPNEKPRLWKYRVIGTIPGIPDFIDQNVMASDKERAIEKVRREYEERYRDLPIFTGELRATRAKRPNVPNTQGRLF